MVFHALGGWGRSFTGHAWRTTGGSGSPTPGPATHVYGLGWVPAVFHGLGWVHMVFHGLGWVHMVLRRLGWVHTVFC